MALEAVRLENGLDVSGEIHRARYGGRKFCSFNFLAVRCRPRTAHRHHEEKSEALERGSVSRSRPRQNNSVRMVQRPPIHHRGAQNPRDGQLDLLCNPHLLLKSARLVCPDTILRSKRASPYRAARGTPIPSPRLGGYRCSTQGRPPRSGSATSRPRCTSIGSALRRDTVSTHG